MLFYRESNKFMDNFASTRLLKNIKQPSTKISYILKSGLSRDANSKVKTNF